MKVKEIIAGLQATKEEKNKKALKTVGKNGNPEVLEPMLNLLQRTENEKIEKEIIEIFSSLKDSAVAEEIIRLVKDENYKAQRQIILSTMWNAPVDYSYYIADIVETAVDGNFMEALDCLTIMENMEGPFEERHILEAQWQLKEYLEDETPKTEQKKEVMSEIARFIKEADQKIMG